MKLDEELNYMETCNDRHKQSQTYLIEKLAKETDNNNQNTIRMHEMEMAHGTMEKEENGLRYEIDNLRMSSEELMNRKQNLAAEIAALDKHMGCISHTNKQLSVELDGFVIADEEVQGYLNKKGRVESIKARAEEQLHMTLAET